MRVTLCLLIVSGCLAMRLNPVGWSAQNHARLQALLDQPGLGVRGEGEG